MTAKRASVGRSGRSVPVIGGPDPVSGFALIAAVGGGVAVGLVALVLVLLLVDNPLSFGVLAAVVVGGAGLATRRPTRILGIAICATVIVGFTILFALLVYIGLTVGS